MTAHAQEIRRIVATLARREADQVGDSMRITQDLGLKSINRIELSAILENSTGVALPMGKVLAVQTVGELVALVAEHEG